MINRSLIYCSVILCFVTLGEIFAQKEDLAYYKQKYPGESVMMLSQVNNIVINVVKDSLDVELVKKEEGLCLDNNAMLHAGQSVSYSGYYPLYALTAKTMVPVKSKFKSLNVSQFDTSDYRQQGIFHNDVKRISFTFPRLSEGAKTLLEYKYRILEPRLMQPFYFNSFIPVKSAELTVTFPENVEIGYKQFNCDSINLKFEKTQKKGKITYKWMADDIPKLQGEADGPELAYYAAHMYVYIKSYTVNGKKIHVLNNTDDLFNWYLGFVSHLNKEEMPQLKNFVDSLVSGIPNELDKVKKIFFWVQDHIKYIAFEAGREGFEPRNANLVFNRRFGDCKDMASLINGMLSQAGIKSYITWIGTRHIPYTYEELPLPAVDNHMIATYKQNGKVYFLDATTGQHPFGFPSYMIQTKEALLKIDDNKYEIIKVPEVAADRNVQIDTLYIKLDGKKIIGKGVSYFRGYERFEMYHLISQKDRTTQQNILKNYFEKGNNKFLIDDFSIINLDDRDKDLIIKYTFNLADYAQVLGDEIFINLNMEKVGTDDPIKPERKVPIENNYKSTMINHVVFEIPKGYKIEYLPENTKFDSDLFSYSIGYKVAADKISVTHKLVSNYLLLQPDKFALLNKMNEQLQNAYKESVNIIKSN